MSSTKLKRVIPRKAGFVVAVVAVLMTVGSTLAFHVGDVALELDGNVANGAAPGVDWATLFDTNGNDTGVPADDQLGTAGNDLGRDFAKDFVPGAAGPDPSYHEPSNKDDQPIAAAGDSNVWGCRSVSNATDKDDILNAYAIAYTGQGEDAGDLIISFGVERFDDSGTAFLGFWVFQKDVRCNLATGKFNGAKTDGDILILANFSNGGDNVTVQAKAWHPGNPAASAAGTFTDIGAGVACNLTADTGATAVDMCAISNGIGDQNVSTPWGTEDKTKPGPPNPDPANVLEPPEFVEGAINLTDAFAHLPTPTTPPACFGSFMAETRSSDTLSATLKDFALGDLDTCNASVSIAGTATNRVGVEHTFTVTATQNTGAGTIPATDGHATVTLTGSNGITAADISINAATSTCDDAGDNLNAAGQCVIKFTSTKTGVVTGNASVAINLGGGSVLIRDTDPATAAVGAGPAGSEIPAVKTYVNAKLDIAGDGVNRVDANHNFTVTAWADDGDNLGLHKEGGVLATVQFAAANGTDPIANKTCTTSSVAGASFGTCSVSFTSSKTGTHTGTASATVNAGPAGGQIGIAVTTGADFTTAGAADALKTWVDAALDITGDGTNRVGVNHEFKVTAWADDGDGVGLHKEGGVLATVAFANANGTDPIANKTCTTSSVAGADFGTCSVSFTSTKTGTHTGTASASISAGPTGAQISIPVTTTADFVTAGAADALKTWVNATILIEGNDTNSVSEPHTFTVTVKQDTGNGLGLVGVNDLDVDVTLANSNGAGYVVDTTLTTCDVVGGVDDAGGDTAANGTCVVVFTSPTAGTVTGSATASVSPGGVTIALATGTTAQTGAAVKVFVAGKLFWLKHDGDGHLLGGAKFEVCRTHRLNTATSTMVAEDIDPNTAGNQPFCFPQFIDNAAPDFDPADGQLEMRGLILGRYTVRETQPPAGYHIATPPGAGPFTFPDMSIAAPDVHLATIFVNIKAFRIIVITCDDISHELVVSSVDLNIGSAPAAVDSMNLIDLSDWNTAQGQDVTQGQLCGGDNQTTSPSIGGDASFGDLPDGTYDIRTIVPKSS